MKTEKQRKAQEFLKTIRKDIDRAIKNAEAGEYGNAHLDLPSPVRLRQVCEAVLAAAYEGDEDEEI